MKGFKKVLTGILAATMIFGASMNVAATSGNDENTSANSETVSITIDQSTDADGTTNVTHTYYQIFAATYSGSNYAYYIPAANSALKDAVDAITIEKNGETIDVFGFVQSSDGSRYNVTLNDKIAESDGPAIATALNVPAVTNNAIASDSFGDTVQLSKGYYLITSSLGSGLVLQTIEDQHITEKNSYITTEKTASLTNMSIGQAVTYTIKVKVPASATVGDEITVHDTLDTVHLQMQNDLQAKVGDANVTLNDGVKKADTETFAKKFTVTEAMLGNDVVLTYSAILLSTAVGDQGYINEAFSNTSSYETLPSKVRVWTFDVDLKKNFVGVNATDAANYSATFKLEDAQGKEVKLATDTTGYYVDATGSSTITVNGATAVNIRGLAAGTYKLTELTTAEGFNLLTDAVTVIISDTSAADAATNFEAQISHKVQYKIGENGTLFGEDGNHTVSIDNNSGSSLPSTGGIGTTIFYIIGGLLIVAAVVFFVVRRKSDAE